jgi:hypothetical protein
MSDIDDKELEKLALTYSKEQGDDCLTGRTRPGTPVGECITLFCGCDLHDAFKAGYRACEAKALDRIQKLEEALNGILSNVATDWYVQKFYRPEMSSIATSGVAAKIHNHETLRRIEIAFYNARQALKDDGNE